MPENVWFDRRTDRSRTYVRETVRGQVLKKTKMKCLLDYTVAWILRYVVLPTNAAWRFREAAKM